MTRSMVVLVAHNAAGASSSMEELANDAIADEEARGWTLQDATFTPDPDTNNLMSYMLLRFTQEESE